MKSQIYYSKKGKRKLSEFFAKELIFDFLSQELDENREKYIRDDFSQNNEVNEEQRKIQKALIYCKELSSVTVNEHLNEFILMKESYLEAIIQRIKFHDWPVGVKVGLETLMVVGVLVLILIGTPWDKIAKKNFISNSPIIITEVSRSKNIEQESENKNIETVASEPLYKDEVSADSAIDSKKQNLPIETQKAENSANTINIAAKVQPQVVVKNESPSSAKANSEKVSSNVATSTEGTTSIENKVSGGFLYRGQLSVSNLKATRLKLNAMIADLGGRKAGEVELGWLKTQNQAYYHFTIPEAKYDELITFLSGFGKPQLKKERHPRVMPDGINRIIFVVDEKSK